MEIQVDGRPLAGVPGEISTLGQLAGHVRRLVTQDKLVIGIETDGRLVEADELEAAMTRPIDQWERIAFTTCSAAEAALSVLHDVDDLFEQTSQIQETAVDLLRQSQSAKAREHMAHCFSIWQQAQQSVSQVAMLLAVKLDSFEVAGKPFAATLDRLRDNLQEVKEALEARDFVLLADILEYELEPTTAEFRGVIAALEQVARQRAPGGSQQPGAGS